MSSVVTTVSLHKLPGAAYRVLLLAAFLAEPDASGRALVEVQRPLFANVIGCSISTVNDAIRACRAAGTLAVVTPAVTTGSARRSAIYAVMPGGEPWG